MHSLLTTDLIHAFRTDGVTLIRGLFADCVEPRRDGVAFNLQHPGPYAAENLSDTESGRFFFFFFNWARISEFPAVIHWPHIVLLSTAPL